ncbi:MAG: ATP-binding protein [Bacteroidota bacterium]|nr:ATP-binding protein [Bacteroidota bacterium]
MTHKTSSDFAVSDTKNHSKAFPDFHNYDGEYYRMLGSRHFFPEMFFYLRTKQPPQIINYENIDALKAIDGICENLGLNLNSAITCRSVNFEQSQHKTESRIIQITDQIILSYNYHNDDLTVMHTNSTSASDLILLEEIIRKFSKNKILNHLNLLVYEQEMGGFRLNEFKLPEVVAEIKQHYNDDFVPVNDIIMQRLSENKSKGIVLLHGAPGTGKTSYIRYLIGCLNKKMIYIPSNVALRLGDPEFLPFLQDQKDSVLIIEDAEDILQERKGGDSGAIANLLNLSDGLLSDCLNIQILCTFNAPLTQIDKALLRKGRVIASYEFKPLTIDKSNQLLQSLHSDFITSKELTLAEVYYQKDADYLKAEEKTIGFGQ